MKPLLISLAVLAVVGALAVFAAFSWFMGTATAVNEGSMKGLEAGAEIGRHVDEAKCLELAKERAAVTSSLAGTATNSSYLEGCLLTSRSARGFCRRVPPKGSELATAWLRVECPGPVDQRGECRRLAALTQEYCADGARKASMEQVRAYIADEASKAP